MAKNMRAPEEKRKDFRSNIEMEVKCKTSKEEEIFSGYSKNIGKGGIFLESTKTVEVGTPVDLEFTLPQTTLPMHLNGVIKWKRNEENVYGKDVVTGMGIKFEWKYLETV